MTTQFTAFCFLFLLSYSYCSECTDKTNLTEEEINYGKCYELKTSSNELACSYDINKNVCYEKSCSDYDFEDCQKLNYYLDINGVYDKSCMVKSDKSGCELISCESLTSNCDSFDAYSRDIKCVLNSDSSHCEIQKCSDLTSDCGKFVPDDFMSKCALNEEKNKCEITIKSCEELDSDKCNYGNTLDGRCFFDSVTKKCKLYKCEDLSSSECTKFDAYDETQICIPIGTKCEIRTSCSELDKDVCETIKFNSPANKCSYSTESGCTFSTCNDLSSNCEQFIPLDPLYKCASDEENGNCQAKYKDCEELSAGQCNLYDIEVEGKKCVEEDGKCVLNYSKKLGVSLFVMFFLFFFY